MSFDWYACRDTRTAPRASARHTRTYRYVDYERFATRHEGRDILGMPTMPHDRNMMARYPSRRIKAYLYSPDHDHRGDFYRALMNSRGADA